jgi:hypothetical protein
MAVMRYFMRNLLLILLLFALAACRQVPEGGAAPTPVTVSPTMTAPIPVSTGDTPTDVATQAPEAPIVADPVSMTELGITDPILANSFKNVDNTVAREADGTFSVNAISYEGETAVEGKYIIDTTTFSDNPEIKNEYAPLTVKATDSQGNNVTLIWDSEHGAWRMPFAMVDNSDFSKVDQIPFVPEGDEKIAIESALLYFKDHPPFTDAAAQNYNGNSLLFTYDARGKSVILKSKGNDVAENRTPEKATMKVSNLWIRQNINGVRQDFPLIVILDPADPKNPKKDEFKILLGVGGEDFTNFDEAYRQRLLQTYNGFLYAIPIIYGDDQFKETYPLLAQLLALSGNGIANLDNPFTPGRTYQYWIDQGLQQKLPYELGFELNDPNYNKNFLPSEIQLMRLFILLGHS